MSDEQVRAAVARARAAQQAWGNLPVGEWTFQFWHEKAVGRDYDDGYIYRYWFYNDLPQPASGMFLNADDPILKDRNVRLGLAYAMNFDKVIKTVLRGDYQRMQTFNEGFGDYDNKNIHALYLTHPQAKNILLYFHGNAGISHFSL